MNKDNKSKESGRIKIEKKTIDRMIRIYCRYNHHIDDELCEECKRLHQYAFQRLYFCPFGENKPVCSECKVHCYNLVMRDKIKEVMRFSGPKMVFRHPYLAVMHLLHKK